MASSGYLNTEIPANELCVEEFEGAQKITASIVNREGGAQYLNLTVDYSNGHALIKMQALNDKAKEEDGRFNRLAAPYLG